MSELTRAQQDLLRPFGQHFLEMYNEIIACSDEQLQALATAASATSVTNCGWEVFAAAQFLAHEIRGDQYRRRAAHRSETA